MDIYLLANRFSKLVAGEENVSNVSNASNVKIAGRENRRAIEKKLRDAKQVYDTRRLSLQGKRKQYEDMASVIDKETNDMNSARDYMRKAYDILKNMDLVDSNEVRMYSDDVGYIKKNRIYRLKLDDHGNVELEPFRRKQLPVEDAELGADDLDAVDENCAQDLLDADELLSSLV